MICQTCGATVAEGSKYCPSCGEPLDTSTVTLQGQGPAKATGTKEGYGKWTFSGKPAMETSNASASAIPGGVRGGTSDAYNRGTPMQVNNMGAVNNAGYQTHRETLQAVVPNDEFNFFIYVAAFIFLPLGVLFYYLSDEEDKVRSRETLKIVLVASAFFWCLVIISALV